MRTRLARAVLPALFGISLCATTALAGDSAYPPAPIYSQPTSNPGWPSAFATSGLASLAPADQPKDGKAGQPGGQAPGPQAPAVAPEAAPPTPEQATPPGTTPEALSQAPPAGTATGGGFDPNMVGDLIQGMRFQVITVPKVVTVPRVVARHRIAFQSATRVAHPTPVAHAVRRVIALPAPAQGFKIAEDESPRPQDRVFVDFSYFDNVNGAVNAESGTGLGRLQAYRELFGFEKTFLDGNASIGMRLPLDTLNEESGTTPGGTFTDIGDLSVILKYAFVNDPNTGNVLSAGMVLTFPTGPDAFADAANLENSPHSTILQPYLGYIWNSDRWFVHGFASVAVPTDTNEATFLFNDIGVGYWLLRNRDGDGWITGVVPTVEAHVNTPLNHRGGLDGSDPDPSRDIVDITSGVTLEFNRRSTLAVAAAVPVTGPKPFDWELLVQFNWRFGPRGVAGAPTPGNVLGGL
jgi:hypothetical protein